MAFQDLSEYFDPALYLPIRGKTYRIPAPSAHDGLRLQMLLRTPELAMSDRAELDEIMKLLGAEWVPNIITIPELDPILAKPLHDDKGKPRTREVDNGQYEGGIYAEMAADGLAWEEIMHAGRTALLAAGLNRTLAEAHWVSGMGDQSGNPLPPKPGADDVGAKAATPKATTRKAATGRTPAARKRTAKATRAAATGTRKPRSGRGTTTQT